MTNPTLESVERLRSKTEHSLYGSELVRAADVRALIAALDQAREALSKAKAALLSGDPDGITRDDVTIYRLDGGKVGIALDAARSALALLEQTS